MKNEHIKESIIFSLNRYRKIITHRDDRLFTEFLPKGYDYTMLSSVDDSLYNKVALAKFHLGMLITLLDDFADHPKYHNPRLLKEIYKLPYFLQEIKKD